MEKPFGIHDFLIYAHFLRSTTRTYNRATFMQAVNIIELEKLSQKSLYH
jgi:hypothetical protein